MIIIETLAVGGGLICLLCWCRALVSALAIMTLAIITN